MMNDWKTHLAQLVHDVAKETGEPVGEGLEKGFAEAGRPVGDYSGTHTLADVEAVAAALLEAEGDS